MSNDKNSLSMVEELKAKRKNIEIRILKVEKYNYNQKEHSANEMIEIIKKIIEEEMKK